MSSGNSQIVEQTSEQPLQQRHRLQTRNIPYQQPQQRHPQSPAKQGWQNVEYELSDGQGENWDPQQNQMKYEDGQEAQKNTFEDHQQCSFQATPSAMTHGSQNLASIPDPVQQNWNHAQLYWDPIKLEFVQRDQMDCEDVQAVHEVPGNQWSYQDGGIASSDIGLTQANPTASEVVQQRPNQFVDGGSVQRGSRSHPADGIEYEDLQMAQEVPEVRRTPSGDPPSSSMQPEVVPMRPENTGHHHCPIRFQGSSSATDCQAKPVAPLKRRFKQLEWENPRPRHPLKFRPLEVPRRDPMKQEDLPLVHQGAGNQGSPNHPPQQVFQGDQALQQNFQRQGFQNPNIHGFQQPQLRAHKVSEVASRQNPFHNPSLPSKVSQHQGHPSGSHQKPFQGRHQPWGPRSGMQYPSEFMQNPSIPSEVIQHPQMRFDDSQVPGTQGFRSQPSGDLQKTFQQGRSSSHIGQLPSTPSGFPLQPPTLFDFCKVVGDVAGTSASHSNSDFRPLQPSHVHQRGAFDDHFKNGAKKLAMGPGCARGTDWARELAPKAPVSRLQEPMLFPVKTIPRPDAGRQRKVERAPLAQWALPPMADAPITEADQAALLADFFLPIPPPVLVKKSPKKASQKKKKPTRREAITDADEEALLAAMARPVDTVEKDVEKEDRLGMALFGIGTEESITEEEEDRPGMREMAAGYWSRK